MAKLVGLDGKPQGGQLDPSKLKDIKCEQCESKFFRQVQAFKRVSALLSQTGKEQIVPVPTFRCDECGYVNEEFRIPESNGK